ncbi:hypothetical protein IWQ62_003563 [Dispira parvispora]|uniref:Uncharacterized protein n=1 Tax=Dispira parvispora TaxID=1520584 RepID=A0A9W8AUL2_9FUNG|nr:hypothetical protein IWQ62_003563 [Dispira parvispora]
MDMNWCIVCDKHIDAPFGEAASLYCSETCKALDANTPPSLCSSSSSSPLRLSPASGNLYALKANTPRGGSVTSPPLIAGSTALYSAPNALVGGTSTSGAYASAVPRYTTRPIAIRNHQACRPSPGSYYCYSNTGTTTSPTPSPSSSSGFSPRGSAAFNGNGQLPMYRLASPPSFNLSQSTFSRTSSNNYCTGSGSLYLRTAS